MKGKKKNQGSQVEQMLCEIKSHTNQRWPIVPKLNQFQQHEATALLLPPPPPKRMLVYRRATPSILLPVPIYTPGKGEGGGGRGGGGGDIVE